MEMSIVLNNTPSDKIKREDTETEGMLTQLYIFALRISFVYHTSDETMIPVNIFHCNQSMLLMLLLLQTV